MQSFQFTSFDFNPKTGTLLLDYKCGSYTFQEKIIFPGSPFDETLVSSLKPVFFLTHIALGISYYKAFCSEKIEIFSGELTLDEANFFNHFYLSGLGEFAIRNDLNLQGKISFPYSHETREKKLDINLKDEAFVAVGGGKDSCVTIEMLKSFKPTLFSVGIARPIEDCIKISSFNSVMVRREISPTLLKLNETGKVYNGHVPISGMIAFISFCLALLHQKRFVVLSNERSANVGNMKQGMLDVNHQWSKSFEFEESFYKLTKKFSPEFRYFSILRPLSEIHIAKLFAQKCEKYHSSFTSCNKAFKLDLHKRLNRWCGCCDKCRFVFLILAPFLSRPELIQVFGSNPLNDEMQEVGYKELLGLSGHKPFECVGEVEECRYAWFLLQNRPDWKDDILIQKIKVEQHEGNLFIPSLQHMIPEEFRDAFKRFIE